MRKRWIGFIVIVCILFCSMGSVQAAKRSIYNISNYEQGNITFTLQDKVLSIDSHLDQKTYQYFMVRLFKDKDYYNQQFESTKHIIEYSLKKVPKGIYYLEIYYCNTEYGNYKSYMFGNQGIQIKINKKSAEFVYAKPYKNNLNYVKKQKDDEETLYFYLQPTLEIQSQDKKIVDLAKKITKKCDSDYERAIAIHDWVCDNIYYNYDALYGKEVYGDTSALGTYKSKKSVCQGYAQLTAALMRAIDIPTKVVVGYALGVSSVGEWTDSVMNTKIGNHAWNEAYIDDRWVMIDTTWDSNNRYQDGKRTEHTGLIGHKYFDISIEMLSNDHLIFQKESNLVIE